MSVFFFLFRHRPAFTAIILLVLAQVSMAADPAASTVENPAEFRANDLRSNDLRPNDLRPNDSLNQSAFDHYYNLDYDAAIQDFERILARHPNDPFAVNHLLSAIQVRE